LFRLAVDELDEDRGQRDRAANYFGARAEWATDVLGARVQRISRGVSLRHHCGQLVPPFIWRARRGRSPFVLDDGEKVEMPYLSTMRPQYFNWGMGDAAQDVQIASSVGTPVATAVLAAPVASILLRSFLQRWRFHSSARRSWA